MGKEQWKLHMLKRARAEEVQNGKKESCVHTFLKRSIKGYTIKNDH